MIQFDIQLTKNDNSDIANNGDSDCGENHLQPLLSFPGQADWMSSIRKACVLILLYVRHFFSDRPYYKWSQMTIIILELYEY